MKFQQPAYFFVPQNCNLQLMKDLQDTLAMWKDSVEQNSSEVRICLFHYTAFFSLDDF